MNERNKIYILYNLLEKVIEFSFTENATLISFMIMKYISSFSKFLKSNLVDKFNIKNFPKLLRLYENWALLEMSFEFKSFVNLLKKELIMIENHFENFLTEAKDYVSKTDKINIKIQAEFVNEKINMSEFSKLMLNYIDEIKNIIIVDKVSDKFSIKCLLHINNVLDVMVLEDFFENFIDLNSEINEQKYYTMFDNYNRKELYNIINGKINITKEKLKASQIL